MVMSNRGTIANDAGYALGRCRPGRATGRLIITPDQPTQTPLPLDPIGAEDAGLVSLVGRLERDRGTLALQSLQGDLVLIDQRDDDGAVIGRVAALDDDD